uniref:Uncharacterized protein n=1 Tax=Opuntia streptacantha TaxID=393608 RepID=A0A7C9EN74_OPUST
MMNTFSIEQSYRLVANNFKAESKLPQLTTFSKFPATKSLERVRTTLSLPGKGRFLRGILSHVFLPIITAFFFSGFDVFIVISLKNLRSDGNFQGNLPSLPIPISLVAATTTWYVLCTT